MTTGVMKKPVLMMNTSSPAAEMPGALSGSVIRRKTDAFPRAEGPGRQRQPVVDGGQGGEDREHRVRQQAVHHADDDGEAVVQQGSGASVRPMPLQEGVDEAVVLQQHRPGEVLHQDAGPERQQYHGEEDRPA